MARLYVLRFQIGDHSQAIIQPVQEERQMSDLNKQGKLPEDVFHSTFQTGLADMLPLDPFRRFRTFLLTAS